MKQIHKAVLIGLNIGMYGEPVRTYLIGKACRRSQQCSRNNSFDLPYASLFHEPDTKSGNVETSFVLEWKME